MQEYKESNYDIVKRINYIDKVEIPTNFDYCANIPITPHIEYFVRDTLFRYNNMQKYFCLKTIRRATETFINESDKLILVYSTIYEDKLHIIIGVSKQITNKFSAHDIAKKLAEAIQGNGGGRVTLAQVGCKNISIIEELSTILTSIIKQFAAK